MSRIAPVTVTDIKRRKTFREIMYVFNRILELRMNLGDPYFENREEAIEEIKSLEERDRKLWNMWREERIFLRTPLEFMLERTK